MGTQPALETLCASIASPQTSSHYAAARLPLSGAEGALAREVPQSRLQILSRFDQVFSEVPAATPEETAEAFRLRYKVYCLDRGYENADDCHQGMERDPYDDHALHCLLRHRISATVLGTVRLVLPPSGPAWFAGLPLADYAPLEAMEEIMRLPRGATAEVSRFAITRDAPDVLKGHQAAADGAPSCREAVGRDGERLMPYMSLGLVRGLVRLSMLRGVTHWCLAAEPSLLRRLRSFGLHFKNAGPLVDHRGLRQVCHAKLEELLAQCEAERPEFWEVITGGGQLLCEDAARGVA